MSGSTDDRSAHGSAQGVQIIARLDVAPSPNLPPMSVALDISIDPGLHIYGLPVPEGFIPLSIDVTASQESVSAETPRFPPPTPHQMEGGAMKITSPFVIDASEKSSRFCSY